MLVKLALPTVAAQLINMLYNIVDRIYIGHIPEIGATALTGVGVCMPLILIVSAFAALVGYGGAPRASIFMGKQDKESAEKILGNCFTLQILISVILTVILLIWNRDLLMAFGASENTIEYGVSYMNIYALGTIFVEVTLGMNAFITAQGFAKTGMLSVLIGAIANIILDPIFIFGLDMDVRGAALATIISQALSCIWVVYFLCGKKTYLKIKKKNLGLAPKVIMPCLALGVATFIMQASESVISVCFNSSLQKYGGDIAVGAMTILTSVMQFAMLPLQGLGQGAQPIISYNYGAGDAGRVRAAFKLLLKVSLGYSVILWGLVMLFPGGFAAMFTSDPQLMEYTRTALRIYMAAVFLMGIQMACQMTFNALGKATESIVVAVMRKFILLIPLIYIMPLILKNNQTLSVYMAEPIADTIAVAFTAFLFAVQFKKIIRTIEKNRRRVMVNNELRDLYLQELDSDWEEETLEFRKLISYYECAVMEIETKLKVLDKEFSLEYDKNPIAAIQSRVKSNSGIMRKLKKRGLPTTLESIENNVWDVAGLRVICSFPEDVYLVKNCILKQDDIRLIQEKDYIKNPKPSGYRSLHLIVEVPIFLQNEKKWVKAEIQIRTLAMDFWASLEHKLRYKKNLEPFIAEEIAGSLQSAANTCCTLDRDMERIRTKIREALSIKGNDDRM